MQELKEKLRQAEQNFNYADENYLDAAIMELNAAEERLNARVREEKTYGQKTKELKKKISGLEKWTEN